MIKAMDTKRCSMCDEWVPAENWHQHEKMCDEITRRSNANLVAPMSEAQRYGSREGLAAMDALCEAWVAAEEYSNESQQALYRAQETVYRLSAAARDAEVIAEIDKRIAWLEEQIAQTVDASACNSLNVKSTTLQSLRAWIEGGEHGT